MAAIALVVFMMLGTTVSARVLGVRLRLTDETRPLWAALAASAWLIVRQRERHGLRVVAAALLAACGVLGLIGVARNAWAGPPSGDIAVIESSVLQAANLRVFLGPYSRFLWHHPGPLYFFWQVPFYVLSGYRTTGLAAGALAINVGSIVTIGAVSWKAGGSRLAALLTAGCVLYVARFDALLTSQWNPHVLVLPTLALVVCASAIASGMVWLLPIAMALGSFAVQTHLGLAPTVAVSIGAAIVAALATTVVNGDRSGQHALWRSLNVGLWTLAALWFLPLVEQVTHSPGNLTRLWRFFSENAGKTQPVGPAFRAWSGAIAGPVDGRFGMAWGGGVPSVPAVWAEVWALVQVALVGVSAVVAHRARRPFHAALAGMLFLVMLTAFWSVTRIAGDIIDHEVFWMSGLGALGGAVLVETAFVAARQDRVTLGQTGMAAVVSVLLIASGLIGVAGLRRSAARSFRPDSDQIAAETLADAVIQYVHAEAVPSIRIDVDGAAWHIAAGVIVQLQKARIPFAVEESAVWMFGETLAPTGDEKRTVLIGAVGRHEEMSQSGAKMLAGRRGYFADLLAP